MSRNGGSRRRAVVAAQRVPGADREVVVPAAAPVTPAFAPAPTSSRQVVVPREGDPFVATRDREFVAAGARVAQLEQDARARLEAETVARRDALATGWVTEGRISAYEREHYRGVLDIDEARASALAANLAPGRIPVLKEAGVNPSATGEDSLVDATLFRLGHGAPKAA